MRRKISLFFLFCTACALLGACARIEPSAAEIPYASMPETEPDALRTNYTLEDDLLGEDYDGPFVTDISWDSFDQDVAKDGSAVSAEFIFQHGGTTIKIIQIDALCKTENPDGAFTNCTVTYQSYDKTGEVSLQGELPMVRQDNGAYTAAWQWDVTGNPDTLYVPLHERFELTVSGDYTVEGKTESLSATVHAQRLKVRKP